MLMVVVDNVHQYMIMIKKLMKTNTSAASLYIFKVVKF